MSRKAIIEPSLITHVTVAAMMSIDTATLRDWVARGEFPAPHSIFQRTWLYKRKIINHFVDTGEWLPGTKFRPGVGRGREPR